METSSPSRLFGSEIHGFVSMEDLDVDNMIEEAKARWLRPNEIHAILCNYKNFTVHVKPVMLPTSGTVMLFNRRMLRNFRKDGHNWKKKKDGKTIKEAHEHLKVGSEERIHVYYAHGEDKPTFVRRCYWLLDKSLEHIVLVHYRETQELQGSPFTPGNSNSSSAISEPSSSWPLLEGSDSAADHLNYGDQKLDHNVSMSLVTYEQKLHDINTLEWDELLVTDDSHNLRMPQEGKASGLEPMNQYEKKNHRISHYGLSSNILSHWSSLSNFSGQAARDSAIKYHIPTDVSYQNVEEADIKIQGKVSEMGPLGGGDCLGNLGKDGLQALDSFGRWMANIIADSPDSVDDHDLNSTETTEHQPFTSGLTDCHQPYSVRQIFNITEVSPSWAVSTEETKVLVVGFFNEGQKPCMESNFFIACGDSFTAAEVVQDGVFRCFISPQAPGSFSLYLTLDGRKPISQVMNFEFRAPAVLNGAISLENKSIWEEFQLQLRLAHLLFSSKSVSVFSAKLSQNALKEAKAFARKTSHISNSWAYLTKMAEDAKVSFPRAKDNLYQVTLQNRLNEWLLERLMLGCKIPERDEQGQGVIHLCAILGYTWAVHPFSCSNLSIDYRDKFGWTALHWASYYGRDKMVACLLSVGAKPYLVTDPTSEKPGGCTAADLASKSGYDGLAAYLAEKALVEQLKDMTLAGNVSGSLQFTNTEMMKSENLTEEELNLKETLAAYRTAADAAARIQVAFQEHSLKVRAHQVSETEIEVSHTVAAMKIQHAFRKHKKMAAAARIQNRFRTWKLRREFLNTRQQAIRIQAVFRGYQVRKQYRKIIWSVGVLEKAILRWRLKRKGIRGFQEQPDASLSNLPIQEHDVEEDFFQASRKQAEERVERSVVKVQAMFRSKQAQEQYRKIKLEQNKATMEYQGLLHPDFDMG